MKHKIIRVLHPREGVHRIQVPALTPIADFHEALAQQGYIHSHPEILASMMNSSAHKGRGIHVVHRDGFYLDGENLGRNGDRATKPVPEGATFGAAKGDDVSVEKNGRLITNPEEKRKVLAEAGE